MRGLISDGRFEEHFHVRFKRVRNVRFRLVDRRALGSAAGQFNDMHDEPPAFFVALEFQIEREIVARDDFVNKRVHGVALASQPLRLQSSRTPALTTLLPVFQEPHL